MKITFEKARDILIILSTAFSGLLVWGVSKIHSSKRDKLDYETKLLAQLQEVSERYAKMHKTFYAMQETVLTIERQNKNLLLKVKEVTDQNILLKESIEHLTTENGNLKSIVMKFSATQPIN